MGFLTEIYLNQLEQAVNQLAEGNYQIEARAMVLVQLYSEDHLSWEALCMNELVLASPAAY